MRNCKEEAPRAVRLTRAVRGLRIRRSCYWLATIYVGLTSLFAGMAGILHASPVFDEVVRLGYPPSFATMLGVWKVFGVAALWAPGRPLLKEWAYAGFFFDFSAAAMAYASVGDGFSSYVGPVLSLTALFISWHLRPASRRLAGASLSENRHRPGMAMRGHCNGSIRSSAHPSCRDRTSDRRVPSED